MMWNHHDFPACKDKEGSMGSRRTYIWVRIMEKAYLNVASPCICTSRPSSLPITSDYRKGISKAAGSLAWHLPNFFQRFLAAALKMRCAKGLPIEKAIAEIAATSSTCFTLRQLFAAIDRCTSISCPEVGNDEKGTCLCRARGQEGKGLIPFRN